MKKNKKIKTKNNFKREGLSKKLRFEIFKRDKFTCQYCGSKAPDVILEIDHINPVALGGKNEILNLITSCKDCNSGKKAIPLNDNIVLEKQRKQLEELAERREQIDMMFEWKKSLEDLKEYPSELLIKHIDEIIFPHTLNNNGKQKINNLTKKFSLEEIFNAIDKSKSVYLRYNDMGILEQTSINNFINKLGGIIHNTKLPPVEQKIRHIIYINKKKFYYFNDKQAFILLRKLVNELKEICESDEEVFETFCTTMNFKEIAMAKNWTEWQKGVIEYINIMMERMEEYQD